VFHSFPEVLLVELSCLPSFNLPETSLPPGGISNQVGLGWMQELPFINVYNGRFRLCSVFFLLSGPFARQDLPGDEELAITARLLL
jgi:hypothetical protein